MSRRRRRSTSRIPGGRSFTSSPLTWINASKSSTAATGSSYLISGSRREMRPCAATIKVRVEVREHRSVRQYAFSSRLSRYTSGRIMPTVVLPVRAPMTNQEASLAALTSLQDSGQISHSEYQHYCDRLLTILSGASGATDKPRFAGSSELGSSPGRE